MTCLPIYKAVLNRYERQTIRALFARVECQ